MLLPYLHERKIYLNRLKLNTDYFYTSVETNPEDEDLYHKKLTTKIGKKNQELSESIKRSLNSSKHNLKMENIPTTFTSIICLNETESKFYVYT